MDHHWVALRKQGLSFGDRITPQFDSRGVSSPTRSTFADTFGFEASDVEISTVAGREKLGLLTEGHAGQLFLETFLVFRSAGMRQAASQIEETFPFLLPGFDTGLDELNNDPVGARVAGLRQEFHLAGDARGKALVRDYVESTHGQLTLHFLPGYAPDLNPDELVWSHVKRTGTARRPLQAGERLDQRIDAELAAVQRSPRLVRSFFQAPSVAYIADC